MRMAWLIAASGLGVVACGGSGGSGSGSGSGITSTNKGCSFMFNGSYTFTYVATSGDCPSIPAEHAPVTAQPGTPAAQQNLSNACPGGSGSEVATPASAGGCVIDGNFTGCQASGSSQTFDISEQVTWNAGYTAATGTVSLSVSGGCAGGYAVTVSQP